MRRLVLLLVIVPCLAADEKDDADKKAREALQGTWTVARLEVGGKRVADESLKEAATRVEFQGSAMIVIVQGKEFRRATIKLDPAATPGSIDTTDAMNQTEHGIYELSGDTLKLCIAAPGAERPKEFVSKAAAKTTLWVLKRSKS
jgi:uncharacterized protein (TIGR03067 family)